jgi:hypothetical protein
MRCTKCKTTISISDWKCPKCGNNLLQLGAVELEESGKKDNHGRKSLVSEELHRGFTETAQSLVSSKIGASALFVNKKLQKILARHIPDEDIEQAFDTEILPAVDSLSREKDAQGLFVRAETEIKSQLGAPVYDHYVAKGGDVLKILRAGEVALALITGDGETIDLSVKMFPFFKASEKACSIHTAGRYKVLKDAPVVKELDSWVWNHKDNLYLYDAPGWLVDRKKTLTEVIHGIVFENDYFTGGSLRTGIALYVFGRDWVMKVRRGGDTGETRTFAIANILNAQGNDKDKELLANDLHELQKLRNERMHKDVEDDEEKVRASKALTYKCLRSMPGMLVV